MRGDSTGSIIGAAVLWLFDREVQFAENRESDV